MKIQKLIATTLVTATLLTLSACSGNETPEPEPIRLALNLQPQDSALPALPVPPPCEPVWLEHGGYSWHVNNHLIGWISVGEGRGSVNYPVVQRTLQEYIDAGDNLNNHYYLNRVFDPARHHQHSDRGTIFADRHAPVSGSRRPDNTIIYGHNMTRNQVKFNFLINYRYNFERTYREFPTAQFTTIYTDFDDPSNTYLIFAGMLTNVRAAAGPVFDYHRRRIFNEYCCWGFDSAQDNFYDFIGNVMDRSSFVTDVDIQFGDEFITLSTCDYPLGRDRVNSRFVLFARRLRPGESLDDINFDAAREVEPLYFDAWYADSRTSQTEWAGRQWDTNLVRGFGEWLADNPDWDPLFPQSRMAECPKGIECPRP
jgi:hypothetical protein